MVSPTGQFIVPASCPGFLLVNFITDNLVIAKEKMILYQKYFNDILNDFIFLKFL